MKRIEFPGRKRIVGAAGLAALLILVAMPTRAELRLDITRGVIEPMSIAVTDFYGASPQASSFGREIAMVVSANLDRSGLFRPLSPKTSTG